VKEGQLELERAKAVLIFGPALLWFVGVLIEGHLLKSWNIAYFSRGLRVIDRTVPVHASLRDNLYPLLTSHPFDESRMYYTLLFSCVGERMIALAECYKHFYRPMIYVPVMRGVIQIDDTGTRANIIARPIWSAMAFPLVYGYVIGALGCLTPVTRSVIGFLVLGLMVLIGFTIMSYLIQKRRFQEVVRFIETGE
jgi:hypothetical protein